MQTKHNAGRLRQAGVALLLWLGIVLPALAIEVPTLYTAEVPLDREAENPRGDAYEAALVEVLNRVTDASLTANPEAIAELFPNPAAYVTQFRPGSADSLWVSFDGKAIERTLRGAGQTVWGADRPLTLVWIAVDWGQGEREILGSDDAARTEQGFRSIDRHRLLRERMLAAAARRGLPIVFPLLDTTDLQSVTFSDIWGGFDDRVLDASRRYEVNSVLVGRIRPGSGQADRWSYFFGGEQRAFGGTPEAVVAQVAGLLAAEFAVGGDAPVEVVELNVAGVASVDAYGNLQRLLGNVAVIERFAITEVSGDTVSYRVEVRGGRDRLSRALRFNGLVEQEGPGDFSPGAALEFFYGL